MKKRLKMMSFHESSNWSIENLILLLIKLPTDIVKSDLCKNDRLHSDWCKKLRKMYFEDVYRERQCPSVYDASRTGDTDGDRWWCIQKMETIAEDQEVDCELGLFLIYYFYISIKQEGLLQKITKHRLYK